MTTWDRALYRRLTDDDSEQRSCAEIPDAACREAPRSFILNAANGACTKLAEQLASPGLVLTWLLGAIGAPVALVGWLEPLRQGGSMLPQLAVSAQIRARRVRKWFWVGAGTVQAGTLIAMAAVVLGLEGLAAGIAVLGLLAVFSVASGVGSVAFSDVVGKTVPKGKRGQLLAVRAAVGGGLTLAAGIALRFGVGSDAGMWLYAGLLLAAAALWALAAVLFGAIPEQPGATAGGRNALAEVRSGLGVLASQPGFRRYLVARALLLPVELAVPYYALHSRGLGLAAGDLGVAIVAVGIANLVSSPIWGRVADRVSSRLVMAAGGGMSALASGAALGLGARIGTELTALEYAPVFFLAGLAIAGVRLGRKTYLVDATGERDRSLYVSLGNTLIGALTFAWGLLGLLADAAGMTTLLASLLGLAVAAAAAALWMPEAAAMRHR